MARVNAEFMDQVSRSPAFNAGACMNCGVCSAVCPMGLELLPRKLFRYVLLGLEGKVLGSTDTIYSCLLCKSCEVNCPSGVHIAENVRLLRNYINTKVFKL